ncbi:kelch domain-containing protein 2 [Biomphalaria pfeifferi]|uniref:Kelch domain-containing protein 2 n=1 Tax=Biomphalaria pfeifferi TaxID=112525 RepID=A0AAD8BDC8_BIOPF|nr:kelch domain-containing protein 2 [Biomphalaria pfeifferi]
MSTSQEADLLCLYNIKSPPVAFTKEEHQEETRYICKFPKGAKIETLMILTQGFWNDSQEMIIDVDIVKGKTRNKLCSLNTSQRCFQWSESASSNSCTLKSLNKCSLVASINNKSEATTKVFEPVQDSIVSSPVLTKIKKSDNIQKENETTPKAENMLSQCRSPLPVKPSKRKYEDENTPKPKTRRQRASMNAPTVDRTPPCKQKLLEAKVLNTVQALKKKSPCKEVSKEGKITRCVDLSVRALKPSNRWGHTMTLVNSKQAVIIGGQGDKQLSRDSVWYLDPEMRSWKSPEIQTEGAKPEYRMGHSATYDPTVRCIYVFGGSKNAKWFHDVHMFDLDEKKWTLVKANGKAPTRSYHSATLYRHELWIFGGVFPLPDPQPDGCDNEIHIFSPVMENWYKPIVTGDKPLPRSGHSATLLNDQLVIFGGWDFPFCYNDLFILDLTTVDWSSPKCTGQPPKPRCWHASCAITNERIFIHGGYDGDNALYDAYIFHLENKNWQRLALENAPSPRAGHGCFRLPSNYESQEEDEIIIFGGGDNDGTYFSDLLAFYVPFKPKVYIEAE